VQSPVKTGGKEALMKPFQMLLCFPLVSSGLNVGEVGSKLLLLEISANSFR
jgi:hypothetical protein